MEKGFRLSEGALLAAFPLLGVAVVAFHQLGRHMFYSVPLEFFELDTAKMILSAAPFLLYGLASLYSVAILYNNAPPPTSKWRPLVHLLLAAFVTSPFWMDTIGIGPKPSWPTIAFVLFFALCTWGAEGFWRKLTSKGSKAFGHRVEAAAGISLVAGVLILVGAYTHGAILVKDQPLRTFVGGTNQIVVLRSGDLLITKTYDPSNRSLVADRTELLPVSDVTMLESRKAPID